MTSNLPVVNVHSVAEAYLYVKTLRCPTCAKGPLREAGELTRRQTADGGWVLNAACDACRNACTLHFQIDPHPTREEARGDRINPTTDRSKAIDLLGWLTLFQSIIAASEKETNKQTCRQLAHEAAQCLDEALRFYDADNEMPPEDAFFSTESRQRCREHPEQFARSKWRQRRMMLPDAAAKTRGAAARNGLWWQFWRKRNA